MKCTHFWLENDEYIYDYYIFEDDDAPEQYIEMLDQLEAELYGW